MKKEQVIFRVINKENEWYVFEILKSGKVISPIKDDPNFWKLFADKMKPCSFIDEKIAFGKEVIEDALKYFENNIKIEKEMVETSANSFYSSFYESDYPEAFFSLCAVTKSLPPFKKDFFGEPVAYEVESLVDNPWSEIEHEEEIVF